MKTLFLVLVVLFFLIPLFALVLFVKRFREGKRDDSLRDRFLESIMEETRKKNMTDSSDEKEPEELDESILLAKKIAAETFPQKTAEKNSQPEEDNSADKSEPTEEIQVSASEKVTDEKTDNGTGDVPSDENKLTREQALKMVENMLGGKKKKDSGAELREMMMKFAAEKNKK